MPEVSQPVQCLHDSIRNIGVFYPFPGIIGYYIVFVLMLFPWGPQDIFSTSYITSGTSGKKRAKGACQPTVLSEREKRGPWQGGTGLALSMGLGVARSWPGTHS